MSITNVLAGVAVRSLDEAVPWYTRLLGRAPDERPMANLAEWRFEGGGWLQLFEDAARAGRSSMTLVESSYDARLADLAAKGIVPRDTFDGKAVRAAIIDDPDGNQLVFAQGLDYAHRSTM